MILVWMLFSFYLFYSGEVPRWLIKATILVAWFTFYVFLKYGLDPNRS